MSSFSGAHRLYVKSLYRRFLTNELDWAVNRQEWRARAMTVRADFERNRFAPPTMDETGFLILTTLGRNVHDPRALATILQKAEAYLAEHRHPDRYIRQSTPILFPSWALTFFAFLLAPSMPDGTKWSVFSVAPLYAPFLTSVLSGNVMYPCARFTRPPSAVHSPSPFLPASY
jgi:NADH dehydrogenase (ubiquinone) 1 beta subcomplex subunit 9